MKYKLLILILWAFCSCRVTKNHRTIETFVDSLNAEKIKLKEEIGHQFRQQQFAEKEAEDTYSMEIIADNVFYWHPDSGIKSRLGNLTVKAKVEQGISWCI